MRARLWLLLPLVLLVPALVPLVVRGAPRSTSQPNTVTLLGAAGVAVGLAAVCLRLRKARRRR